MNKEAIKDMAAGKELDWEVAKRMGVDERLFKFTYEAGNHNYSSDESFALTVVEKLVRGNVKFTFETEFSYNHYFVRFRYVSSDPDLIDGEALEESFALAICKAALVVMEGNQ